MLESAMEEKTFGSRYYGDNSELTVGLTGGGGFGLELGAELGGGGGGFEADPATFTVHCRTT
jgi:hypothetical protein